MTTRCACTPGTFEDGWQEVRCDACLDEELKVWFEALDRFFKD